MWLLCFESDCKLSFCHKQRAMTTTDKQILPIEICIFIHLLNQFDIFDVCTSLFRYKVHIFKCCATLKDWIYEYEYKYIYFLLLYSNKTYNSDIHIDIVVFSYHSLSLQSSDIAEELMKVQRRLSFCRTGYVENFISFSCLSFWYCNVCVCVVVVAVR